MELLYGKPIAEDILGKLKTSILQHDEKPGLAVILAGDDPASQIYVNLKEKAAKEIGMEFYKYLIPEITAENDVLKLIALLNDDRNIHGVIVQLPLPEKFNTEKIMLSLDPEKDVDGFHPENVKKFLQQKSILWPVFPSAIIRLIEQSGEDLKNKQAVVISNSKEFGELMRAALWQKNILADYFLSGDISSNLGKIKDADIVVSAVGSPGLLRGEMFKEGAIVVDGGIEKAGEKIVGDVDFASTKEKNGFLTPVPGGVGPVTIACLLENVYLAFKAQQKE